MRLSVAVDAPEMFPPSARRFVPYLTHWYVSVALPLAETLRLTLVPGRTTWLVEKARISGPAPVTNAQLVATRTSSTTPDGSVVNCVLITKARRPCEVFMSPALNPLVLAVTAGAALEPKLDD